MNRVLRTAAAASALVVVGLGVNATQAQAANGHVGATETVCATDLQFRTAPGGARAGTLHRGDHFVVYSISNGWVYGHAYGDIHHDGYVQDGWFC